MEDGIKIISYQMNFKELKKEIYKESRGIYDITIIKIRLYELQKHAGRMKKINKPSVEGTKITFDVVQTVEEYEKELKRIIEEGEKLGLEFKKVKTET